MLGYFLHELLATAGYYTIIEHHYEHINKNIIDGILKNKLWI